MKKSSIIDFIWEEIELYNRKADMARENSGGIYPDLYLAKAEALEDLIEDLEDMWSCE